MYERCLNEAERLLATSKNVVLPVKEVWRMLAAEGKRRSFEVPALTDFDALLEGDRRFELLSAQPETELEEQDELADGDEVDSNLGTLGFYPEDRVKLRRVSLPGESTRRSTVGKAMDDDEDVVPLNVRGLSATKPVRPVESRKQDKKSGAPKKARQHSPSRRRAGISGKRGKVTSPGRRKTPRRSR